MENFEIIHTYNMYINKMYVCRYKEHDTKKYFYKFMPKMLENL